MPRRFPWGQAAATLLMMTSVGLAADAPSVKQTLAFTPKQKDLEYETPDADKLAKCKVEVEKRGNASGWVVLGPEGQVLRRFVDSDGDGQVDQWRYFNHGVEVYRDIDTNKNNKPDQYRWLNLGGSRWGIDSNEDGKVDTWKSLSAPEASREAIRAAVSGDEALLKPLLITAEDLKSLGVEKQLATKILASTSEGLQKVKKGFDKSKVLTAGSKWVKFDALTPSLIPSDDGKATQDLHVYENAMAIVENGKESGLVQIGEMVRVGDVWKLTQAPTPIEGPTQVLTSGVLMQPVITDVAAANTAAPSPELQKLLDELQKLDEKSPPPTAGRDVMAKYHSARADLLVRIYNAAESDEEKTQWMKQLISGLSAMVQTGAYPEGLDRIKAIEKEVRKTGSKSPLVPYVTYQRIFAEYTIDLQKAEEDKRSEVMKTWLKGLEDFIGEYPSAEDVPDAMLHLAMNDEFMGKAKEATAWYTRIVKEKPKSAAAPKAQGAITRLNIKGKPVSIKGPGLNGGTVSTSSYQGKAVLVMYWATWCQPCTEELPQLRALYNQYASQGFEIIGISLDMTNDAIPEYLKQHKVTWPQIYQPGGLESPLAVQYGVFSPPVMILLDKEGKAVSRNITVAELKNQLPAIFKGK